VPADSTLAGVNVTDFSVAQPTSPSIVQIRIRDDESLIMLCALKEKIEGCGWV
jgi:hypothetical protein